MQLPCNCQTISMRYVLLMSYNSVDEHITSTGADVPTSSCFTSNNASACIVPVYRLPLISCRREPIEFVGAVRGNEYKSGRQHKPLVMGCPEGNLPMVMRPAEIHTVLEHAWIHMCNQEQYCLLMERVIKQATAHLYLSARGVKYQAICRPVLFFPCMNTMTGNSSLSHPVPTVQW